MPNFAVGSGRDRLAWRRAGVSSDRCVAPAQLLGGRRRGEAPLAIGVCGSGSARVPWSNLCSPRGGRSSRSGEPTLVDPAARTGLRAGSGRSRLPSDRSRRASRSRARASAARMRALWWARGQGSPGRPRTVPAGGFTKTNTDHYWLAAPGEAAIIATGLARCDPARTSGSCSSVDAGPSRSQSVGLALRRSSDVASGSVDRRASARRGRPRRERTVT